MSVCNLGIFGTKYEHSTPIPSQINIKPYSSSYLLKLDHIAPSHSIGNTLDIKVRVKNQASYSWVTVDCKASFCDVSFAKTNLSGNQEVVL